MKFRTVCLLLMTLSIAAMTSCKKESYSDHIVTANFEAPVMEDNGEKLYYTGSSFVWKSTDKVGMWDHHLQYHEYRAVPHGPNGEIEYSHDFNMTASTDQPSDAVAALDQTVTRYSFYPTFVVPARTSQYIRPAASDNADPVFTIELKPQQILDNEDGTEERLAKLQLTRFPVACKAPDTSYHYKSLCGILRLDFGQRNMKIKSIKFESIEGKQVSGLFDVSWDNDLNPVLTPKEASDITKHSVTLTHYNPVDLSTQNRYFYIYLPQNSYKGFKLTLVDDQGRSCTKSWKNTTIPITRNRIQPVSFAGVTFNLKQKSGVFTTVVDCNGDNVSQVYISSGNLQYVNTNWQFASQQYELLHSDPAAGTYTPDQFGSAGHEWDMFRWSIAGSEYGKDPSASYASVTSDADFIDYGQVFGANSPWRTLSGPEWFVLLHARHTQFIVGNQEVRFLPVYVRTSDVMYAGGNSDWPGHPYTEGVAGILLVPDDYTLAKWQALGLPTPTVINATTETSNMPAMFNFNGSGWTVCDKAKFAEMEKDGLIFLPFTFYAFTNAPHHFCQASYWSSSHYTAAIDQNHSVGTNGTAMRVYMQSISGWDMVGYINHGSCGTEYGDDGKLKGRPYTWKNCVYIQNGQSATEWGAVRLVRDAE